MLKMKITFIDSTSEYECRGMGSVIKELMQIVMDRAAANVIEIVITKEDG